MRTETALVAEQARLNEWAAQIRECRNRPKGMNVSDWCCQQGLTKSGYYYRLRRVRQAMLDQLRITDRPAEGTQDFVELTVPSAAFPSEPHASAILRGKGGVSADIFPDTSPEVLRRIVEALAHAE